MTVNLTLVSDHSLLAGGMAGIHPMVRMSLAFSEVLDEEEDLAEDGVDGMAVVTAGVEFEAVGVVVVVVLEVEVIVVEAVETGAILVVGITMELGFALNSTGGLISM